MIGHPLGKVGDGGAVFTGEAVWVETAVACQAKPSGVECLVVGSDGCVFAAEGVFEPMGDMAQVSGKTGWCRGAVG